ncbi:hypothetical protein FisN_7Lu171 [Fistulifera solaris]|uniref:Uncharacterized protein n=1 Tax=Fistulifera solaris TaxID=1519565 RepID=A0A1Z5JDD4_FISSO|nr:hypothetical protein FisN_7Lu171 [Fistulifera solaris]|eukprot:GAX11771.1 hypothetical protein FisN_7Lu171 [Fistulifera solaris]
MIVEFFSFPHGRDPPVIWTIILMKLAVIANIVAFDFGSGPFALTAWGILMATTFRPVPERILTVSATLCFVLAYFCAREAYLVYTARICRHLDEFHNASDHSKEMDDEVDKFCHMRGFLVDSNGIATILWFSTAVMVWKFPESRQLSRNRGYDSVDGPSASLYRPVPEMELM